MGRTAAITVYRAREETERLWRSPEFGPPYAAEAGAAVSFTDAPGGRGTEIRVDLDAHAGGGRLSEIVQRLVTSASLAKVKDDLRHFKQLVEAGEIARSDGAPDGERLERKLRQRPAQPVAGRPREEVTA